MAVNLFITLGIFGSLFSVLVPVLIILIPPLWILLFIAALVDIRNNQFKSEEIKIMFILLVILAPIVGVIFYYTIGKKFKIIEE